ncbi:hypothetical protein EDEG_03642 [Edhazardia aedis USNM 41457]|uniref:Mitochondrial import inner membrane translocase subunit TIM22 n=1 Tax=Edhazardia aedis (strain USNM 41457) TaxID=1003232 RepID=J8ZQB2_EDHAE|nr:hypothetical protein EDEG_03642 [Edhazardia aedis USNM 41457]|eukprot:EJW01883.1 hypothetical protein EDEG_03642 [Edhazardia aedis USNM 41457]
MDLKNYLKSKFTQLKPALVKTVSTGAQGYVFGSMVGLFTQENDSSFIDTLKHVNKTGLTFAKVGVIYSTTETVLEQVRKEKCVWNSVVAGTITGAIVGSKKGNTRSCAIGFGLYSGLAELNKQ